MHLLYYFVHDDSINPNRFVHSSWIGLNRILVHMHACIPKKKFSLSKYSACSTQPYYTISNRAMTRKQSGENLKFWNPKAAVLVAMCSGSRFRCTTGRTDHIAGYLMQNCRVINAFISNNINKGYLSILIIINRNGNK